MDHTWTDLRPLPEQPLVLHRGGKARTQKMEIHGDNNRRGKHDDQQHSDKRSGMPNTVNFRDVADGATVQVTVSSPGSTINYGGAPFPTLWQALVAIIGVSYLIWLTRANKTMR
ncbi:hypothetical protein F4678DRAFT_459870 [Xylaria arbuscula]|nr:hypothetical protein F4678DRAFT_459870 [Xylaria arbuscula]